MTNKLYEKIKEFIKNYYKVLIFYGLIIALFTVHIPYNINMPGGLINTNEKVKTSESYNTKGSLNMTYVAEMPASIPTYLLSLIKKDWDLEKVEESLVGNETIDDLNYRGKMLLLEANSIAKLVAFENSKSNYEIESNKVFVTYVDDKSATNLKVKDQIIKVDGKHVTDKNFLYTYVASKNIGEKLTITVIRNGKEKEVNAKLISVNKEPKIGVVITETFDITSDKNIEITKDSKETGPSGGMMMALTIYSKINKEDLTKGKIIAGTGTIDRNGNIGEISGIKYKIIGAVNQKADLFIVPKENYKEAKKIKEERNYNIDILPVETFQQAINYLKK